MPWKATSVVEERVRFVLAAERGELSMRELCAAYGISRETGYKWRARFASGGLASLADLPRTRLSQPTRVADGLREQIVSVRRRYPHWGPKKLRAVLAREHPGQVWPAASTIGDVLGREGLIEARVRSRPARVRTGAPMAATAPNQVWGIDFKGWFRTRDGRRCDPLTVSDLHSRYLLMCEIAEPTEQGVWAACERLFGEHGQPAVLRMDNGTPFGGRGAGGLTRLSVRWVKLGIGLAPITPGRPQENGRHERMHRTLKEETSRPASADCAEQQRRFDAFRHEFNEVRPHEALGQVPPASVHRPNERAYTGRLEEPWYDADHEVHRVRAHGDIRYGGGKLFVSEALPGELIGIAELPSGDRVVRFGPVDLGVIPRGSSEMFRFTAPRTGRSEPEQT